MNQNSVFQALSDQTRRSIIRMLREGDSTPGDMLEHFNMTKPSLSHHLDILKKANLVTAERHGQNIVYSLNVSVFEEMLEFIMGFFQNKSDGRKRDV